MISRRNYLNTEVSFPSVFGQKASQVMDRGFWYRAMRLPFLAAAIGKRQALLYGLKESVRTETDARGYSAEARRQLQDPAIAMAGKSIMYGGRKWVVGSDDDRCGARERVVDEAGRQALWSEVPPSNQQQVWPRAMVRNARRQCATCVHPEGLPVQHDRWFDDAAHGRQ